MKLCLFVSGKKLFHSQSDYIKWLRFLFRNLQDKQSFFVIIVLHCTVWYLLFLFKNLTNFFILVHINLIIHCFGRGKYKSFDCYFKVSRLLSNLIFHQNWGLEPYQPGSSVCSSLKFNMNAITIVSASAIICRRTSEKIFPSTKTLAIAECRGEFRRLDGYIWKYSLSVNFFFFFS